MDEVGKVRIYLLRAMYAFIAFGLGVTTLPDIVSGSGQSADSDTIINAILMGFCLLSLLGIKYPLKMLPLLLLELTWKVFWLLVYALPMHLSNGLDEYAQELVFACAMGVILTPLVLPWGYLITHYLKAPATPWK
ncbi:hypothetical protein [Pseudoalteromonas sp. T1lg24]|uniref:hypothetical protein n=1 Tax=Pseudoalteromonas sp. T1lg24 TaxID=2077099 RepID=UPI000CF62417|nr:hypothetical protein [Pseudoalteromonas sp. T1lg24]